MKIDNVPMVAVVASGKGGVGKTTVTSDIAHNLKERGFTVGVVDADISTPNTPSVLTGGDDDFSDQRLSDGENLIPVDADGIQLISQGLSLPDDVVLLRDGQFRAESVVEYIQHVEWDDDTDVVLVDSPPGSGEEVQVILQAAAPDHAYIVTTSHSSSLQDAHRTSVLMEQADVPASVVVNMTHIPGEDVLDHVWDEDALKDVKGIGDAKSASIRDVLQESVEDYPLFRDADDIEAAVGNPIETHVPYTTNDARRRAAYDDVHPTGEEKVEVEA